MYTFLFDQTPPDSPQLEPSVASSDDCHDHFLDKMILPLHLPVQTGEQDIDECVQEPERISLEFIVESDELLWHDIPLMDLIAQYGTPLKLTYMPSISSQIQHAKSSFRRALRRHTYQGRYTYCYPTKSSQFRFVLDEVIRNDVHLETSSPFDISILKELYQTGKIDKSTYIICNGHKQKLYTDRIGELIEDGFNVIPVIDSLKEIEAYTEMETDTVHVGIRIAIDEPRSAPFRTSRLGVRYSEVSTLYRTRIRNDSRLKLKMLHFFVESGIRDCSYFWSELSCFVYKYCEIRKICADLDSINIGGGLPISLSLGFKYDFGAVIDRIIGMIASICDRHNIPVPHLFTEFGSYTVGESGATFYEITEQKQQNAKELWYMIDGSFITQLPDIWASKQHFICLPLNNWSNPHRKVMLGGITCDSKDYYPSGDDSTGVNLPTFDGEKQKQYIGFFHTGAYQEALGGYGGISHCLIPAPAHVLIEKNSKGRLSHRLFAAEQGSRDMLHHLGYTSPSTPF
ncbi:Orn/DAP/Arg decarboxylase 2 [Paraphoma chrysanthemicola]|nr:Orn/DAP/Arg decarboxylase 2 [Paraphoma chrysanthemicola]